jgi:ribosomal protein S27E
MCPNSRADTKFRHQAASCLDLISQSAVLSGVNDVQPRPAHRDGHATRRHSAFMGGTVDPECQPADNNDTVFGKAMSEVECELFSSSGWVTTANNCDRWPQPVAHWAFNI